MRVLFISHEDSKFGAPKSLMELIKTLKVVYNVEPIILLHSKDDVYKLCEEEHIEKYVIGHRNCITKKPTNIITLMRVIAKKIIYEYAKWRALKKIINDININSIDIIHTNVSIVDIGLELNKRFKIPHIIHLREPASIMENYFFCRNNYIDALSNYSTKAIAISNYIQREWAKRGLNESKISTIYNGLDLSQITASQHKNDKINIVFCGSFSEEKGQIQLIEAIKSLPKELQSKINVDFVGQGDPHYQTVLANRANDYGLGEIIHFKGYIEKISQKLNKYDIGVICSKGEPFGRVTVEYMAASLCVVASSTGASPEIIKNKVTGYLYPYANIVELTRILTLIISNKNLIISVGKNARDIVFNKFTTEENAKNVYSLYCNILNWSKNNNVKNSN